MRGDLERFDARCPLLVLASGNRRARLFTAAGSTNEARSAVRVAIAWGYIRAERTTDVRAQFDNVMAILWKLTHAP